MDATAVILTASCLGLLLLVAAVCYRLGRAVGWGEGYTDGLYAARVERLVRHPASQVRHRRDDRQRIGPANPAWREA